MNSLTKKCASLFPFLTLAICIAATDIPRPEFPQPQFERPQWQTLNGPWSFDFDDKNIGVDQKWATTAHKLTRQLSQVRRKSWGGNGPMTYLRPDGKAQVTVEYEHGRPVRVDTVVVSTQHAPSVTHKEIREFVIEKIIKPCLPPAMIKDDITYHINPTGNFVVGGPHGDSGLTGRKIIVDTYGGWGRHGGGAFSGKDPTKVDRSAAYMARHIAKNIVAAGLADRCEIQLAYAIGVSKPVSVRVDTQDSGKVSDERICEVVQTFYDLTPRGIIEYLDLRRPIYSKTAAGGHFGRSEPEFTWENTSNAPKLAAAVRG